MVDYDPLIPAANHLISDSQADIQNNFAELNTLYAVDHQQWNAGTSAFRGKHKKMTFPQSYTSGTQPALGSDLGILFPQVDPNDSASRTQLYYRNPTEIQQVTNRFHSSVVNNGYWIMPGGTAGNPSLIYMWGQVTFNVAAVQVVLPPITNYVYTGLQTQGFPNNIFQVQVTVQNAAANATNRFCIADGNSPGEPYSKTEFWIYQAGNSTNNVAFWFAIGN